MGREEQNGGLYEEEPTPKQHRQPERTLRYTQTVWIIHNLSIRWMFHSRAAVTLIGRELLDVA